MSKGHLRSLSLGFGDGCQPVFLPL
jgi:hypothetical protein